MKQCCNDCQNLFKGYCPVWDEEIKNPKELNNCSDFRSNLTTSTRYKKNYNRISKTPECVGKKVKVVDPNTQKTAGWGGFRQGEFGKFLAIRINDKSYIVRLTTNGVELSWQKIDKKAIKEYQQNKKIFEGNKK